MIIKVVSSIKLIDTLRRGDNQKDAPHILPNTLQSLCGLMKIFSSPPIKLLRLAFMRLLLFIRIQENACLGPSQGQEYSRAPHPVFIRLSLPINTFGCFMDTCCLSRQHTHTHINTDCYSQLSTASYTVNDLSWSQVMSFHLFCRLRLWQKLKHPESASLDVSVRS